jgi:uncharacterized phiE125 gp8 family phage protein
MIELRQQPVVSITSVSYVDEAGATQTLSSSTQYAARLGDENRAVIFPRYDIVWPTVRRQRDAVTVRYQAGYARLPDSLRQAMLLLIGNFYENREEVITGTIATQLPVGIEALLSPYRII